MVSYVLPKRSFLMSQLILLAISYIVLTQLSVSLNTYVLSHNRWGRPVRPPRCAVGHPPAQLSYTHLTLGMYAQEMA
jgi:hypothetical protein